SARCGATTAAHPARPTCGTRGTPTPRGRGGAYAGLDARGLRHARLGSRVDRGERRGDPRGAALVRAVARHVCGVAPHAAPTWRVDGRPAPRQLARRTHRGARA